MKIEELQAIWQEMSSELEKQKKLTHEIIMKMTHERYKNKLQKIANYEGLGAVFCFIFAIIVLANINKLDSWYVLLCGLFTIAFLLIYPILSLRSVYSMKRINVNDGKHADIIKAFTRARNNFLIIQKTGIGLAFVLMITSLPVASKILKGKDIFLETGAWVWYIPIMLVIMILVSRWGYQHYKRITKSAGNILSEMEEHL